VRRYPSPGACDHAQVQRVARRHPTAGHDDAAVDTPSAARTNPSDPKNVRVPAFAGPLPVSSRRRSRRSDRLTASALRCRGSRRRHQGHTPHTGEKVQSSAISSATDGPRKASVSAVQGRYRWDFERRCRRLNVDASLLSCSAIAWRECL
jgi:hypothetical protein